jgi:hypothetical protein
MTLIPGKDALLATDAGVGFDVFDLADVRAGGSSASAVTADGASSVNPISGQVATCWSSFSKETGNFYLTDIGTAMVTEVNVDDNLNTTIVKVCTRKACRRVGTLSGSLRSNIPRPRARPPSTARSPPSTERSEFRCRAYRESSLTTA